MQQNALQGTVQLRTNYIVPMNQDGVIEGRIGLLALSKLHLETRSNRGESQLLQLVLNQPDVDICREKQNSLKIVFYFLDPHLIFRCCTKIVLVIGGQLKNARKVHWRE